MRQRRFEEAEASLRRASELVPGRATTMPSSARFGPNSVVSRTRLPATNGPSNCSRMIHRSTSRSAKPCCRQRTWKRRRRASGARCRSIVTLPRHGIGSVTYCWSAAALRTRFPAFDALSPSPRISPKRRRGSPTAGNAPAKRSFSISARYWTTRTVRYRIASPPGLPPADFWTMPDDTTRRFRSSPRRTPSRHSSATAERGGRELFPSRRLGPRSRRCDRTLGRHCSRLLRAGAAALRCRSSSSVCRARGPA